MANTYEQEVELQAMFEKRASFFEKMNSNLRGSLAIMQQMSKAMDNMTSDETTDFYENLNSLMETSAERVERYGDTSKEAFEQMNQSLSTTQKLMFGMYNDLEKIGKRGMIWATMASGLNGFWKGLKLSVNVMGSMWNITKNVAASLGHFALSVISFPFKILNGLMNMAQQGGGDNSLRQALEDIRKEFGDLRTGASAAIIDISRSMRGPLAETGLAGRRIFGNLAEALKTFQEVAHNMGPIFNMISGQLTESGLAAQRFGAYLKGLGLDTAEAQRGIARMSITTGRDINELGREITTFAYGMGEAFGINGKEISRDVGKMMHDFDSFGNLSIQTLTNVSVFARKLGVEVEKLKGAITSFDDFEKAAEGAAQLSQAFGLNIDAFQMIQEQDPAARIEQLRKAFFAAGRSVENMTRQERALLAEQTGLDQETLSLVFAQKSQATSYADIQKQSEATKKKQLSQAEAMEKLANSIERMVKSGQGLQGGFFKIFLDGFTAGIMRSREFRGLMRDLRRDMRIVFQEGRQVGRAFVEAFPGVREMLGGLREIFNPSMWRARIQAVSVMFRTFFRELGDPRTRSTAFGNFVQNFRQHFADLFNPSSPGGQRFLNGLRSFLTAFATIFVSGLKFAMQSVTRGVTALTSFIQNPAAAMARMRSGASGASGIGGFVMTSFVIPLIDALREAGPPLLAALGTLLHTLWDKAKAKLLPKVMEWLPTIFRVMFAPAALSGAFSLASTGFMTIFARLFGSMLGAIIDRSTRRGSQQVARGATDILSQAGSTLASAPVPNPSAVAGAGGAALAATEGASAVGPAVAGSPVSASMIPKALAIAAFITIGLIAIIAGIVLLAGYIQRHNISAASLAKSSGVFIAAAVVLGIVGLVAVELMGVAPLAPGATAAIGPAALLLAGLGVIVLALIGLTMVVKSSGISMGDLLMTMALVGSAVLLIGAAILGGAALMAAGVASLGVPLLIAGVLAVTAFATAMAVASFAIAGVFSTLSTGLLNATEAKIRSASVTILSVLAVGAGIMAAGLLSLLPGIRTILNQGFGLVTQFATAIGTAATVIIASLTNIPTGAGVEGKVQIVTQLLSAVGGFIRNVGGVLSNTSVLSVIAGDTVSNQIGSMVGFISMISLQIPVMVQSILRAISSVQGGQAELARAQSIVQVLGSVGQLIGNISRAIPRDADTETIRAAGDFFMRIKDHMVTLIGRSAILVNAIVSSAGTLDPAKAGNVAAISTGITTVLGGIANMFGTILRSQAIREILASSTVATRMTQLGNLFGTIVRSLSSGDNNFFTAIGQVIQQISSSANLNPAQSANLYNISRILGPMLEAIGSILRVVGHIGPEMISGSATEIQAKINGMKKALDALSTGFTSALGTMIPKLLEGLNAIPADQVSQISGKVRTLGTLFNATTAMTDIARNAGGFAETLQNLLTRVGGLTSESMVANIESVKSATITRIAGVIHDYSTLVDSLNGDLRNISNKSNNLTVALQRTRDRLGLSGRQQSSLTVGAVSVTINVTVNLAVDDIEAAIATRPGGSTFIITNGPGSVRHSDQPGYATAQVATVGNAGTPVVSGGG